MREGGSRGRDVRMRRMVGDLELNLGVVEVAIARLGGCARECARRQLVRFLLVS